MLKWTVTTTGGLMVVGKNFTYFKVIFWNLLETITDLRENSKPSTEQLSCATIST
jgi:hypothetical protein